MDKIKEGDIVEIVKFTNYLYDEGFGDHPEIELIELCNSKNTFQFQVKNSDNRLYHTRFLSLKGDTQPHRSWVSYRFKKISPRFEVDLNGYVFIGSSKDEDLYYSKLNKEIMVCRDPKKVGAKMYYVKTVDSIDNLQDIVNRYNYKGFQLFPERQALAILKTMGEI